ncbi:MAG: endonuclease III [Candidatus Marinimicrobia bacterium]|nr:endonuclease III [Candidatus Neomarinimicrobiota bacterium]MBL7023774.1 endonuclease III [Candidatus Neomarinimicrobiota bacterium]MBL7110099.1 endonuclease III [Candidatus Neomarinimicrobiota bacterium]
MKDESTNQKKSRITDIIKILKEEYPNSSCSLKYESPFQLLVATILSAQCTDERVNKVTSVLFEKYSNAESFRKLSNEQIEKEIFSTGFYRNKAKSIKNISEEICEKYDGIVPKTLESLVKLRGVGRKTANVVLGNAFNIPGLVVDTHVIRIANLLKFVITKNAVVIERELSKIIEKKEWTNFGHLCIDHGRAVCIARKPNCVKCGISNYCPSKI